MPLPGFAPLDPATTWGKKGSGTPTDAYPFLRALRARQRAQRSTLACRRSTTALPLGFVIAKVRLIGERSSSLGIRHRQGAAHRRAKRRRSTTAIAMLPGTWRSADPVVVPIPGAEPTQFVRALPALDLSQSSEHLAAQSVVLGGWCPKPPGCGLRDRPRAPHSLRNSDRIRIRPWRERDSQQCNRKRDNCQWKSDVIPCVKPNYFL